MQSNIIQPLDNDDVDIGKNYIVNKLTMNSNSNIDESVFEVGIFYSIENDVNLYKATDTSQVNIRSVQSSDVSNYVFSRTSYQNEDVVLDFFSISFSKLWIVLMVRDEFDNSLKPIYRKLIDNNFYLENGSVTLNEIIYNVNFGIENPHFTFEV